jgi:cobalt-zinc-cadmium efflux system membrane fusion protein
MSQITVFAPLDGEVIEKHATLGEVVKPETILYVIAGLSKVWVELNLYPEDFRSVHKGQAVETATDAVPGKVFQGRVTYVGQFFADETRTLKVRVELNNEQGLLKSGMYVTAHIRDDDEQHVRECLCVPVAAVVQIEERPVVFVAKAPGVFERRAVTLGKRFGEHHEVLVGLEENETVVTEGAFILKSELLRAQMSHDHPH